MSFEYAIIVKNQTRLEALIERFNTKAQAKFYIESLGGNFMDYEAEHEVFQQSLSLLQSRLTRIIKYKIVERRFISSFLFSDKHIILVIGQDGLVANTAKYAGNSPIIGINPDKKRYDGVLLPFDTDTFPIAIEKTILGKAKLKEVGFAEAKLNDGQRMLAFNDLFIGAASHISARYKITYGVQTEEHSSSGLIVSTKAGSSGWLSSVFNMASGLMGLKEEKNTSKSTSLQSGKKEKKQHPILTSEELLFIVREPFKSIRTQTEIISGKLNPSLSLKIESLMPSSGVIFSDGIEKDYLNFNSGAIATIGIAKEKAIMVL